MGCGHNHFTSLPGPPRTWAARTRSLELSRKPRLLRDIEVEVETHLAALDEHLSDADAREVVRVADRQNRCAAKRRRQRLDLRPGQP